MSQEPPQGEGLSPKPSMLGQSGSEALDLRPCKLILPPEWSVPPPKSLHVSHDLISLLQLDGLYNTYVRPYADSSDPSNDADRGMGMKDGDIKEGEGGAQHRDGDEGKKGRNFKGKRLDRAYSAVLLDMTDPNPIKDKAFLSILPYIPDMLDPQVPPPATDEGEPTILDQSLFEPAVLEANTRVTGYAVHHRANPDGTDVLIKQGVAKEDAKRRKRHEVSSALPSPSLPQERDPPFDLATPLLPVRPPNDIGSRPSGANRPYRSNAPTRHGPFGRGSTPYRGGARPLHGHMPHAVRPDFPRGGPPSRGGPPKLPRMQTGFPPRFSSVHSGDRVASMKRQGEPLGGPSMKRSKPGAGSRSASPIPPLPGQARPGMGKGPRSRTEGT